MLGAVLEKLPMFDRLSLVSRGLTAKFPAGNQPFQLVTRLLEECGKLAEGLNHFEGSGTKRER